MAKSLGCGLMVGHRRRPQCDGRPLRRGDHPIVSFFRCVSSVGALARSEAVVISHDESPNREPGGQLHAH